MLQILSAIALLIGAAGGVAGITGAVRVFTVDRHVVKRDDMAAEREYSERLRSDLDAEIRARRRDRVDSDTEILTLRKEIETLRNNWDACRMECQRLRAQIEGS